MPDSHRPASQRPRQPANQIRQAPRRPLGEGAEQRQRAHPLPKSSDQQGKLPILPYAQETTQAQIERTQRLRALRQDFLNHAQTKIEPQKPRNILLAVVLSAGLLALTIVSLVAFFQLKPLLFASSGQTVATNFMDAMQQGDYTDAFANCSSTIEEVENTQTHLLSQQDFIQQAQTADKAGGAISSYTQTGSTALDADTMKYTFTITRHHLNLPGVALVVSKGSDGSWKITSIDATLLTAPISPTSTPTTTRPPSTGAWIPEGGKNTAYWES